VIRAWARTLPKHVLAGLLAVLVLALVLRVWAATHGYEFRHGSDADQYERLAARLYQDGEFGIPGSENPYDFAPGMPFFAAAVYWLTGGMSTVTARIGVAVAGTVAVFVVFLIGRRLGGPWAGLIGAGLAAVYPPTLFYTSLFSSEPLAMLTVAGAVLALMWAADEGRSPWAWALPGVLFGLTAYLRPEYVLLTGLMALLVLVLVARRRGILQGALAGVLVVATFAAVIAPWTISVSDKLGRFVPVSTGGGKALFIGTYLPGDGIHERVKQHLLHETRGGAPIPEERLRRIPMNPLLDRVARRYPDMPRDSALGRIGKQNLVDYATGQPVAFARMVAGKIAHMWHGAGDPSSSFAGSAFHYLVLALGLIGLALLALRRRWEALPIALLLVGISAIGGLLLAGNRRNLPVMPLILALAGVTLVAVLARVRGEDVCAEDAAGRNALWPKNSQRATPS
jgi:4-amino-4-deoxy-L-arabinose transferase-like glycosyltransferase